MTVKPDMTKIWAATGATAAPPDAKIASGWGYEMMPFEWENWIQNRNDTMLSYLNQRGIPEWDASTEYFAGKSYVTGANGVVYFSILDSVGINPTSDVSGKWARAFPSITGGGASGTWTISVSGNAATATKFATARTISITGDATWTTSIDGSANVTGALTLANSGVTAGTYNNVATAVTPITVDAKGRVTAAGAAVTITPAFSNVTGKPTTLTGYGITDATPSSHVGSTGASHGVATTSVAGFMSAADKTKLDGVSATGGAALVGFQQAGTDAIARTAQSKMREVVSAKDFGAVGDGVADDTEALKDAIAYCRSTGAWLHGVGGEIYKVTDTLVFGSDTLAFVNFDGNGCEILVNSATDIYAIDTSGISSAYCECGVIQNVTIRNTPRTTMVEASGGILAEYSGTLKLRNVKVITHGSCVNGWEKISHRYVDCFFTGTNTRAKRGITGQHRNLNVVGGRVYACDVAVVLAGDSVSLSGVDLEFNNIALWSRALTTALIESCHFETTKVLLTNADTLPSLTDVAWLDTTGDGAGCLGVTFQSCHVAMGGYAQAPLIVIKSGPSFSYGLTINDSLIQHNLNKIAGNFAPGTAEGIPSGSRLAMSGTGLPAYGTFPVDAYSRIQVLGGGSVLSSNTTMEMITLGKRASQSISASGGTLDFTTGYGQFSTAVFELHIRAAAPGYEYGCVVTAVQSYDKMTFTRLSALGALTVLDTDLAVSWVAASGTIRLTNNIAVPLTIISSFVVKSVL